MLVGGEFSCRSILISLPVLKIDRELILRLRVKAQSMISVASRSAINRFFSSVHVMSSLSTQSPVYLPAWLPKRDWSLRQCTYPTTPVKRNRGQQGGLMQSVCGHIMATSLMIVKMTFSSKLKISSSTVDCNYREK